MEAEEEKTAGPGKRSRRTRSLSPVRTAGTGVKRERPSPEPTAKKPRGIPLTAGNRGDRARNDNSGPFKKKLRPNTPTVDG